MTILTSLAFADQTARSLRIHKVDYKFDKPFEFAFKNVLDSCVST